MTKVTVILSVLLVLTGAAIQARVLPADAAQLGLRAKSDQPIVSGTRQYLADHEKDGKANIWVFFTDKGIYNKAQLVTSKEKVRSQMSPRAKARLVRNGITDVQLADLPVVQSYIQQVSQLGATLRHVSRWLNAASYEIDPNLLDRIATLPFVEKVQPVAQYHRVRDIPAPGTKQLEQETALEAHSLDYGGAYDQLEQIDVLVCHDSGYSGQGVIISVFDTGFRTTHDAFATAQSEGRVLATRDYVFGDDVVDNESNDVSSAWDHGTSTWSICGGEAPGIHYGPAYNSSFILCKTEDVRSETAVEEDNWVAAAEWVDSLGTDVITSSLSYTNWYTSSDYDGNTCVTTIAADIAASRGIVVCNSAGNAGPSASSLGAPADADSILTVGAVNLDGSIASFSSRGPTADGRIKPEVCARGTSVHRATSATDDSFSPYGSGTSYSCPLVAGAAAIVLSAHPVWTAMQVREALMMTADNASTPDNTFGWGVIDTWAAIHYQFGPPPYVPGDADGNGFVNISDATYIVAYIFGGGEAPDPFNSGDADGNGVVAISDAIYLIAYIFGGGDPPVNPD
jgi:serine protease AprX